MRQPKATRNERQKERQREYRAELKRLKKPTRDHIAQVALWWLINSTAKMGEPKLDALEDKLTPELTRLGFNKQQSQIALADLIERYTKEGWGFQRKLHLIPCPD